MNECFSFQDLQNNKKLREWVYPMFFSTKGGSNRIRIIKLLSHEPKTIQTIAKETKMSYFHTRYHIQVLKQQDFLIKKDKGYLMSHKFRENYEVLDNITNQKFLIGNV